MRITTLAASIAVLLASHAGIAAAQAPTVRLRGKIERVQGQTLHITERSGEAIDVVLAPNTTVTAIAPSSLAEIKPGSYIGTAALPGPEGSLRALEVQVFPERLRGVGEGSRPYDLQPQSSMTNGTVGDVVGSDEKSITVKYQDKQTKVLIAPGTPVITYEPGSMAMLVPGAYVLVFSGTRMADGTVTTDRINVGKDGLIPPM